MIQTSDDREKRDITNSSLGLSFIKALRPKQYKMSGGNRIHFGLLAQDVKEDLRSQGIKFEGDRTDGFAGFCFTPGRPESSFTDKEKEELEFTDLSGNKLEKWRGDISNNYGLRYTEFIAPMIKSIQEVDASLNNVGKGLEWTTTGLGVKTGAGLALDGMIIQHNHWNAMVVIW